MAEERDTLHPAPVHLHGAQTRRSLLSEGRGINLLSASLTFTWQLSSEVGKMVLAPAPVSGKVSRILLRSPLPLPHSPHAALLKLNSIGRMMCHLTCCSLPSLPVTCRTDRQNPSLACSLPQISLYQKIPNLLLSLRKTLFNYFSDIMAPLSDTVQTHADKLHHLKTKMADLSSAHNDLVDAYTDQRNELQHLQNKMADLEDHQGGTI